jgi:predicted DNA-binding protein YlxM (UPF0122 family)
MPAVVLTDDQKVKQAVARRARSLKRRLSDADISLQRIADLTGLTRQSVSYQFREERLQPEVLEAAEMLLAEKGENEMQLELKEAARLLLRAAGY